MVLFAVTIFLSAFLRFQVQPVIARIILPWFGRSSAVWSTCMLFFLTVLLAGYLYVHWLHEKLSGSKQSILHTGLLLAGLMALPIMPDSSWRGTGLDPPSWQMPIALKAGKVLAHRPGFRTWTDDYSGMFGILK